jgi:acetyl esterase/lipase
MQIMKLANRPHFSSLRAINKHIAKDRSGAYRHTPPGKLPAGVTASQGTLAGLECTTLATSAAPADKHVIFLHGGGYVLEAIPFHWAFVATLAKHGTAHFHFLRYPLAPEHDPRQILNATFAAYN